MPKLLIAPVTWSEKMESLCVPCEGALSQRVRIPPGEVLLPPEVLGADQEVTNGLKHSEKRPFLRVSDSCGPQRAANVEQASKYRTWVRRPTIMMGKAGAVGEASDRCIPQAHRGSDGSTHGGKG